MATTRRRTALLLAAVALGAAACSGPAASSTGKGATTTTAPAHRATTTTTTEVPPLGAGQVGTRAQIPWGAVGNGWYVATWSAAVPREVGPVPTTPPPPVTVFLVDPQGGRYLITTLPLVPVTTDPSGTDEVPASWSGDGKRVLLVSQTDVRELDLTTGASTVVPLPVSVPVERGTFEYTLPNGEAILDAPAPSSPAPPPLNRYGRDGRLQQTYPTSFSQAGAYTGSYLESLDGTTLLMAAKDGIAVVSNVGTVERQLTAPAYAHCIPVRWWSRTQFVANCPGASDPSQGLSILDTSGGAPIPITTRPAAQWDSGDLDAWRLGATTYVQVATGCGAEAVGTVTPSKQTAPLTIPQVPDGASTFILGATQTALSIESTPSCGVGGMLLTYTPSSNTSDILLGGPVNGGSVLDALAFPGIDDPTVQ